MTVGPAAQCTYYWVAPVLLEADTVLEKRIQLQEKCKGDSGSLPPASCKQQEELFSGSYFYMVFRTLA